MTARKGEDNMGGKGSGRKPNIIVEDESDKDISGILKHLGSEGGWIVKIYKQERQGARPQWIANYQPDEVSEEMLAAEHGAGSYIIRCWNTDKEQWAPTKRVDISEEIGERLYKGPMRGMMPFAPPAAPDNTLELMRLQIEMSREAADRQMQMMQANNQQMMSLVVAMIQKPNDMAAALAVLKDMGGVGNQISTMKDLVGLARELGTGGDGGGGASDPLTAILNMVPVILQGRGGPVPAQVAPVEQRAPELPAAPTPEPVPAVIDNPAAPKGDDVQQAERLRLLQDLKARAIAGRDPEVCADWLLDDPGSDAATWMLSLINAYGFEYLWPKITFADGALEPYQEWFRKFYVAVREGLEMDDKGGGDAGTVDTTK